MFIISVLSSPSGIWWSPLLWLGLCGELCALRFVYIVPCRTRCPNAQRTPHWSSEPHLAEVLCLSFPWNLTLQYVHRCASQFPLAIVRVMCCIGRIVTLATLACCLRRYPDEQSYRLLSLVDGLVMNALHDFIATLVLHHDDSL